MAKRQTTADERAKNAQRARDRRAALKATRLEQEAADRAKATELPHEEQAAQPVVEAAPPVAEPQPASTPQAPKWKPPEDPKDPWPPTEATDAFEGSAREGITFVRNTLARTRYAECMAPVEGRDPTEAFVRPTAAMMARSSTNLGPRTQLTLGLAMMFGPTFVKHMGELGMQAVEYFRSRREAAGARVHEQPKAPPAQPPSPPPAKAEPVDASLVGIRRVS